MLFCCFIHLWSRNLCVQCLAKTFMSKKRSFFVTNDSLSGEIFNAISLVIYRTSHQAFCSFLFFPLVFHLFSLSIHFAFNPILPLFILMLRLLLAIVVVICVVMSPLQSIFIFIFFIICLYAFSFPKSCYISFHLISFFFCFLTCLLAQLADI